MENVLTLKQSPATAEPIPDITIQHNALISSPFYKPALDYILNRGITKETIQYLRLGAVQEHPGMWVTIPYFNKDGNCYFVKKRAVPASNPSDTRFKGLLGREPGLYNEICLSADHKQIYITEGEFDAITLIDKGLHNVVSVPGASSKKTPWIKKLLDSGAEEFILVYDNDKAGQSNAAIMAKKLGLDKVWNLVLPHNVKDREVKDVNDFFLAGGSLQDLQNLPLSKFALAGIVDIVDVLEELEEELANGAKKGKYLTGYPSLDSLTYGFEDGDLVGILADGKIGKTTFSQNIVNNLNKSGFNALIYCLEMTPVRLVRKHVCMLTQTDDDKLTKECIAKAKQLATAMDGAAYFGYTNKWTEAEIFDNIRQAVKLYNIKVVVFDNLQLMSRNMDNTTQELSVLGYKFKELAMELGILFILIIQPNRIQEGNIVSARNVMGSSAVEKTVDHMICLHRNKITLKKTDDFSGPIETISAFDNQLLVKVDLCRYGPGGQCTLFFDGAKSLVTELSDINNIGKEKVQTEEVPPWEAV
jgi:KaiC/GvpD/RAD55 family RecA-like ATPase